MHVEDEATSKKILDLTLDKCGRYSLDLTKDGLRLAAVSTRGHVTTIQRRELRFECNIQVEEEVYDIKFLNSYKFFAVAQKKAVCIYNHRGIEKCLKNHYGALKLAFMPHLMLITSV